MKIFAGCLLAVMLAGAFSSTLAQTTSSAIRGKVSTDSSAPADMATVVLLKYKDSSVVQSTVSNKIGAFHFNNLQTGSYLIFIAKLNYEKSYSGPYQVISGKDMDVGTIVLKQGANQLSEVSIIGQKDFVEVKADKTVLNVEQNIMAAGATLYDVLSMAPGVKVINEDVLYRGGQKALIAINGKPILLTGDELANFLRNYQSSSIRQIELIDNPAAKYDAAGGGGMINIILKKNKELGSNTTISQTAAYGDKYKLNTSINYTLRTEKLNIFANGNFTNNDVPHTINTSRNIYTGNQVNNFDLNYYATIKSQNNSFNLGADYQLTSRQTISFFINGYDNKSEVDKKNTTNIATNGQPDSSINTKSTINRNIYNFNYNLNYKASIGKSGKSTLSADANYSDFHRHSSEILRNDFFNAAGQVNGQPIFYSDNSPSHITVRSENIDFSQELSKSSNIEAGIKNSIVKSDNMIDFEQLVNNSYVPVTSLTDHFVYNERINAAYLKFNTKIDNTGLSISLRAEQTNSRALSINPSRRSDSSYFQVFPNIQLTRNLDKNNQLTLFYSRNINRPNYQDLNPFVGYVDAFYYSTGNPFLKPAYINTYQLSDLYLNKYKASLNVIVTNNYFNTIFQQNDVTKVYTTTKVNLGTRYQYMAQFYIPVDITNWWQINADLSVFHEQYVYNTDTVAKKVTNGFILLLNQNFKLSNKLSAQLNGDYESPTYYVINQYTALYYLSAGLRYSILKNNGSIRLAVSDIFNTNIDQYHTNYTNLDLTGKDKTATRFIQATFTYHFGNSSVKTHTNKDSSEEQKRLGGSSNEN
jgi:iron complex outermembrane receptor protein